MRHHLGLCRMRVSLPNRWLQIWNNLLGRGLGIILWQEMLLNHWIRQSGIISCNRHRPLMRERGKWLNLDLHQVYFSRMRIRGRMMGIKILWKLLQSLEVLICSQCRIFRIQGKGLGIRKQDNLHSWQDHWFMGMRLRLLIHPWPGVRVHPVRRWRQNLVLNQGRWHVKPRALPHLLRIIEVQWSNPIKRSGQEWAKDRTNTQTTVFKTYLPNLSAHIWMKDPPLKQPRSQSDIPINPGHPRTKILNHLPYPQTDITNLHMKIITNP